MKLSLLSLLCFGTLTVCSVSSQKSESDTTIQPEPRVQRQGHSKDAKQSLSVISSDTVRLENDSSFYERR